jgi:hypothetical protein
MVQRVIAVTIYISLEIVSFDATVANAPECLLPTDDAQALATF